MIESGGDVVTGCGYGLGGVSPRLSYTRAALVIFSPKRGTWWSLFLPGGWRHCFLLLPFSHTGGSGWVLLDPRSSRTEVTFLSVSAGGTLLLRLQARGCVVVPAELGVGRELRRARGLPMTGCVEFVRRVLGLSDFCLTPRGLLRVLLRRLEENR
ncbi:MAG: hypothetical protein OD811_04715 [Alphaproteobacteria bacterium]